MKRVKRLVAGVLTLVMLLQVLPGMAAVFAVEEGSSASGPFNGEGVWLTEIYQNDVDRSQKNNKRPANGYEEIPLYDSTTDLMEFIEITSTHADPVRLNDLYEICYGEIPLTVTDMADGSDIIINKGQAVVLWNYRGDVTTGIPTEEEFREALRIPQDTLVLKVTCGENWATSATFSIRSKETGETVSTFTATDKVDTQDGFSVELKIPNLGSRMEVYRAMNAPSAGYVYAGQLNGLVNANVPDQETAQGVYVTEIRANDVNRVGVYGTEDDYMECIEITNTTNESVDLNKDYQVVYFVKEGSRKPLPLYHYDETVQGCVGSSEDCIVPAGGTAVLWCYRVETLSGYTTFPTEEEFRAAYGISEDVPVYLFTNQNGMNNTNRGVEIYQRNADGTRGKLTSSYCYVGSTDCKDNKSAVLAVNPEGPEMLLYAGNAASSMGTLDAAQITYLQDDGSAFELRLSDGETVPTSILQGRELRVNFYYAQTGQLPHTAVATYFRFDGEGQWYKSAEGGTRVPNLLEAIISADQLFDHDYVEFYVSVSNRYRSALSQIYTVEIDKLNEFEGIRTNIADGEEVSGTVSVTANDGTDNAASQIYIDGVKYETAPVLEDGAYFSFYADGRDSYFKNAITTTENAIITSIGKWQYAISNGQAAHIDSSYFTYDPQTDSYDVTLRFWAGTWGTTVDEYLYPQGNREDFTVTKLMLKLPNGQEYLPTRIGPTVGLDGVTDTTGKTNLSTAYTAVHSIGDSANMCPYMDVSFSVPASEVTAVGAEVDTRTLSDGAHTLTVTNGESTKEVTFLVDNTAPVIDLGVEEGSELSKTILLNPQVSEENSLKEFVALLDGEVVELPMETTAYALGEGEHTLVVFAEDAAGNSASASAAFVIRDVSMTLEDAGAADITDSSAKLYLTLQSAADTEAAFYLAEKIDTANIETNTTGGILPYIQYTIAVGDVSADDEIIVNWNGSASGKDDTHAGTLFVRNTLTGAWDKIAGANADGSIENAVFTGENHVVDGKATVIVQCTADSALPDLDTVNDGKLDTNGNWDGASIPEDYDFSFAWITDTQYYAEQWQYHFLNMNSWIVDNAEALKIKYVMHTGDIVDDWDMIYEWENADQAMRIFDEAGMPYGVLGGNHDVAAGLGDSENYFTYFGEDRVSSQPTYGGSYKNNLGHYDLVSENGQDFLIVYMSWNVYQEEIDWMNQVLAQYSDRRAILCFHPYTNVKESDDGLLDYFGVVIQKEVVAKNPNVIATLNGHYHGSSYQTATFDDDGDGINERTVYQICTDYQSGFEGGAEYIKFLYFDLDNDKIYMNSYSPYFDDFNYYDGTGVIDLKEEADKNGGVAYDTEVDMMVLDIDFTTDPQTILEESFSAYLTTGELLGAAKLDMVSGKAELELKELQAETDYAWYAVAENENTGYLKTGVYEFTTKAVPIPDTGDTDTGDTDTGNTDTGSTDTGSTDTGSTDNGNTDTGNTDTGTPNTGSTGNSSTGSVEIIPSGGDRSLLPTIVLLGATVAALGGVVLVKKKYFGQ